MLNFIIYRFHLELLPKVPNLKQVDPAVMHFSTNRHVIRYQALELNVLKDAKLSQSPPPCLYNPRIIRLNILKYQQDHTEDYESQMRAFRELLPNLSMTSCDPKVLDMLNNYHRSLLFPHNYIHNGKSRKQSSHSLARFLAHRLQQSTFTSNNQPELQPTCVVGRSEAVSWKSTGEVYVVWSEVSEKAAKTSI